MRHGVEHGSGADKSMAAPASLHYQVQDDSLPSLTVVPAHIYFFKYCLYISCFLSPFIFLHRKYAMAIKVDDAPHRAEADAEVSGCVSNLIEAFANGLNIFKRLRERRRKRKARKENQALDPAIDAEHQLSKSLRKGPQEIAEKYAECYHSGMGPRFAKGDCKYSSRTITM